MPLYAAKVLLIGLFTGLLSGAFGVGGALLSTPAIRLLLGVAPLVAVGTPLPVVIPTAVSGGLVYWRRGLIVGDVVKWAAPAGMVGAVLGAALTRYVSGHYLLVVTALIILYVGIRFLWQARSSEFGDQSSETPTNYELRTRNPFRSPLSSLLIGLSAGFVGGLLGIGGGVILVPAFVLLAGMSPKEAFGSSLVTIAFMAVPGTVVHHLLGHIDWLIAMLLTAGVIPAAYIGARAAQRAKDRTLVIGFALFLIAVALYFGISEALALAG